MKYLVKTTLLLLLALTLLCGCGENTEESDGGEKVYCVVSEREYDADGVNVRLTEYTYDEFGNIQFEVTDRGISKEYDPILDAIVMNYGPVDGTVDYLHKHEYDESNNLVRYCMSIDAGINPSYENDNFYWDRCNESYWNRCDEAGRVIARGYEGNTEPFVQFQYDKDSRLIQKISSDEYGYHRETYSYDKNGALQSIEYHNSELMKQEWIFVRSVQYTYDRGGNIVEVKRIGSDGKEAYCYKLKYDNGRLVRKTCYDHGERYESTKYTYDENGNISEARVFCADDGTIKRTIKYEYKELELSSEAEIMYAKRNTWVWYMQLAMHSGHRKFAF